MVNQKEVYKFSKEFERILIEAIDDGLNLLGETVGTVLLMMIRERHNIEKDEIPRKIKEFSSALRSILGNGGGKFVEKIIVTCLFSRLGLGTPKGEREFHEYILDAYRKTSRSLKMAKN
ncbi:MAG: hypothetical protein QXX99_03545 [Candidatus Bathyarchaeia archaeon]